MRSIYIHKPSMKGIRHSGTTRPENEPDELCIQGKAEGYSRIFVEFLCGKPPVNTETNVNSDGSWSVRLDNSEERPCSCKPPKPFIILAMGVLPEERPEETYTNSVKIESFDCVPGERSDSGTEADPCKKVDLTCPEIELDCKIKDSDCNTFNVDFIANITADDQDFTYYWIFDEDEDGHQIRSEDRDHIEGVPIIPVKYTYYSPGLQKPVRFNITTPEFCSPEYLDPPETACNLTACPDCCPGWLLVLIVFLLGSGLAALAFSGPECLTPGWWTAVIYVAGFAQIGIAFGLVYHCTTTEGCNRCKLFIYLLVPIEIIVVVLAIVLGQCYKTIPDGLVIIFGLIAAYFAGAVVANCIDQSS